MPDGDRSLTKHQSKFPTMLSKLFSFFQCKHNLNNGIDLQHHSEVMNNWDHYKNLKAEDLMIPRTDIVAIDYKNTLEDISKIFLKTRHTRMPIYKEELDNIIGFINIKDIFPYLVQPQENPKFKIDKVLRNLLIISPSMKLFALLEEMRKTRTHIALVVDEFGGTDGLITIEDLVEEIIGEIEDEHDHIESGLKEISPNNFEANGRIKIEILEEKLGLNLTEGEGEKYDTLGGLILSISGKVPEKNEKIIHPSTGLIFEILESDPRRIKKVLISLPSASI